MDFFTRFTHEKIPQNNFSYQNLSAENNYFWYLEASFCPTISANSAESFLGWVNPAPLGMIGKNWVLKKLLFFFLDVEPIVIFGELLEEAIGQIQS